MRVVSIKLPEALDKQLTELARHRNVSRSAVLREALESFARGSRGSRASPGSVTQAAGDLVGSLQGPRDLASHSKHMAGYGE
jgi:predicted transcriptional regulator